jgi:hypothetical protein
MKTQNNGLEEQVKQLKEKLSTSEIKYTEDLEKNQE